MRRGKSSGRVVAWMLGTLAATQLALTAVLERPTSGLRDPEYAVRRDRFRTRHHRFPGRPSVAVFGSSRVAMGVRPGDPVGDEPLVVNFGLVGGGPLMQRMALRRLLADGPRPDAALFEYWPPYVVDTPLEREETRVLAPRLCRSDLHVFGTSFDDSWRDARLTGCFGQRFLLMSQLWPVWLPNCHRFDHTWLTVDADGWSTGATTNRTARPQRVAAALTYYAPRLATSAIRPESRQAYDDLLTDCRTAGIRAALVWLPESSEIRAAYPSATEASVRSALDDIANRHGVPHVVARDWCDDFEFSDGYHLSSDGATRLTDRLNRDAVPLVSANVRP